LLISNGFNRLPLCRVGTPVARTPVAASCAAGSAGETCDSHPASNLQCGAAEAHMKHTLFGSLGVLTLGSMALAQSLPPGGVAESRGFERPFAEGGRVHLQLASGGYVIRAGAPDRVIVRWSAGDEARLVDLRELFVNVWVRAGEVRLHGIEGHKDVRMTAGDLKIGVRRESLASAHASVTFGDLDARLGAGDLAVVETR
jgi:hypothetical protein